MLSFRMLGLDLRLSPGMSEDSDSDSDLESDGA